MSHEDSVHPVSARQLLDAWEQALTQQPSRRALTLLTAACPDSPPDGLSRLSIGARDARLLTLREQTFGSRLVSLATCPSCGECLELDFDVSDLRATPAQEIVDVSSLRAGDYELRFRLPNSDDLAAVAEHQDLVDARDVLLQRCLLTVRDGNDERGLEEVPEDVLSAVVERMSQADPQADVALALSCPACHHEWRVAFDIASFFWTEVDTWAKRALHDVHTLAAAYGWRESEILSLSAARRQLYLDMVRG